MLGTTMPYYYSPFRKSYEEAARTKPETAKPCILCDIPTMESQSLVYASGERFENEHYRWVVNWFPRAEAHTMLVPKRHITNLHDETTEEVVARQELLKEAYDALQRTFPESGVEIYLQTGKGSLNSIRHLHWHLVPALPQHDLLGFEKVGYFSTTEPEEEKVVITPIEITIARDQLIELVAAHS